jgi:hypothetical protein
MCFIAANDTGKAATAPGRGCGTGRADGKPPRRCGFVEDLNWPTPAPPERKPRRSVEVWAPGPIGSWEGEVPRVQ